MTQQALYLALEGARTLRGGVVRVQGKRAQDVKLRIAVVGDEVVYADGRVGTITSGAGFGMMFDGKPVALVGSHVSGDDRIVCSPDDGARIGLEHGQWIEGLFDPSYGLSQQEKSNG